MIDVVTTIAVSVLAVCIIMAAYRVIAGPSQPDRVIALDVIAVNTVGLILVLDINRGVAPMSMRPWSSPCCHFWARCLLAKYLAGGTVIDRGDR